MAWLSYAADSWTRKRDVVLKVEHSLVGRVASAWLLWRELADTAPSAALRNDAAAQATKLEPRLPKYTIKVARGTPNLVVQINGRSVASNVPVAVRIVPRDRLEPAKRGGSHRTHPCDAF